METALYLIIENFAPQPQDDVKKIYVFRKHTNTVKCISKDTFKTP